METNTTVEADALVARIRALTGLDTEQEALLAAEATFSALGERLHPQDISAVANVLPGRFARALHTRSWPGDFELEELFRRVARAEGVNLGFAREHVLSTCRALGEMLGDEARRTVQRSLPAPFAALFAPYDAEGAPAPYHAPAGEHHTLATGRPGSTHTIAESRPPIAQSHSVVREKNPHADTKVSSAHGLTQERLDESLATARPDDHHTIAGSKD